MGPTVPQIKKPYRYKGNMSSLFFFWWGGGGVEFTCECVNDYVHALYFTFLCYNITMPICI